MGKINVITWYNNGKVIDQFSKDAGNFTRALSMNTDFGISGYKFVDGSVYVIAENVDGTTQKSNEITLKTTASRAEMSDVSITEDYSTSANIEVRPESAKYVVSVTLNKDYAGKFYLVDASKTEITQTTIVGTYNTNDIDIDKGTLAGGAKVPTSVTEADSTTAKYVLAMTGGNYKGVKRVLADNKVKYVFKVPVALSRGTEYKVIFEQNGIDTDKLGAEHNKSLNLSDKALAPYVKAPTSIKVDGIQTAASEAGWTAQLYTGSDKANYIRNLNAAVDNQGNAYSTATLYSNASNATEKGTPFAGSAVTGVYDGVIRDASDPSTAAAAAVGDKYVYAEFTAMAGIFGKDKLSLTSAAQKTASEIATNVSLAISTTNNKNVDVTIDNLDDDATVYLLGPGKRTNDDNAIDTTGEVAEKLIKSFDPDKSTTYIGKVSANAGARSVAFTNAITKINNVDVVKEQADVYTVIIVPNKTTGFARKADTNGVAVTQSIGSFAFTAEDVAPGVATKAISAKDQYGNEYKGYFPVVNNSNPDHFNATNTYKNTAKVAFSISNDGKITMDDSNATNVDGTFAEGDTFTLYINDNLTLKGVVKKIEDNGTDSTNDDITLWTVSIVTK